MKTFSPTIPSRTSSSFHSVEAASKFSRNSIAIASLTVVLAFCMQPVATGDIVTTTVGTPAFNFVDAHLFTAPTSGYFQALFPSHFPRVVHTGPYTSEFTNGLALTGYLEKQVFSVADFTAPTAVHLGFVLVPNANAPTGSSFDFASGPIIQATAAQPITVAGDVFLNGVIFESSAFGFNLTNSDGTNGVSHFVADVWENSAFAPPGLTSLVGDYQYRLTIRDPNSNGYNVLGSFSVSAVPEPSALLCLLGAAASLSILRWRRLV